MENTSRGSIDCRLKITRSVYSRRLWILCNFIYKYPTAEDWFHVARCVCLRFWVLCLFPNHHPVCLHAASGNRRAQCLPCCGGHLPGVFCMGSSHHPHAHGKPGYIHVFMFHFLLNGSPKTPTDWWIPYQMRGPVWHTFVSFWVCVCRCVFSASNGQRNMKRASNCCIVSKHSLLKGLNVG